MGHGTELPNWHLMKGELRDAGRGKPDVTDTQ